MLFIKCIKETLLKEKYKLVNEKQRWEKISKAVEENKFKNYNNKILMTIQFILEVYVYEQRLQKNVKLYGSVVPFYGQDWHVSRLCPPLGCRTFVGSEQPTPHCFFSSKKISDPLFLLGPPLHAYHFLNFSEKNMKKNHVASFQRF